MRIGGYQLFPIEAGRFRLDGGAMFGIVPKALWNKAHPADELNRIEMVSRSLLLAGEDKLILVNTGMWRHWSEKQQAIYALDPSAELADSLAAAGFAPEQLTHVVLTHLHFDHAGGNVVFGRGSTVPDRGSPGAQPHAPSPAFPNALYYVQRRHLEWALSPSERDKASFLPPTWQCLLDSGQLRLVDGARELWPGIFLELVHGHTPYQQLPRISDGISTLLYCSDLIPFASQVRVPWIMGYDLRAVETVLEKQGMLARAAAENWLLFLEHDPLYECCRVEAAEKGFAAIDAGAL